MPVALPRVKICPVFLRSSRPSCLPAVGSEEGQRWVALHTPSLVYIAPSDSSSCLRHKAQAMARSWAGDSKSKAAVGIEKERAAGGSLASG